MVTSCTCGDCQNACKTKPGWFKPGEAELAAKHLGVPLPELFRTKLMVDWWEKDADVKADTFLLSPAVVNGTPGSEFPGDPEGRCVFYKHGRCGIYEVRPFECRSYLHDDAKATVTERHKNIAISWVKHQGEVKKLLGRTPTTRKFQVKFGFGLF